MSTILPFRREARNPDRQQNAPVAMVRLGLKPSLTITFVALIITTTVSLAQAPPSPEQRAGRYMESIRQKPPLLLAFLEGMPKGGDLHSHLSGAVYAESLIDFAAQDGLCVDHTSSVLLAASCDRCEKFANKPAVACAYDDHVLYNQLVDAWSMRNWNRGEESGHDHFFSTFEKFGEATNKHFADMLADVMRTAAADHVEYLELMQTLDGGTAAELGKQVGWMENLRSLREKLVAGGLSEVLAGAKKNLDEAESKARLKLHCGTTEAEPACRVTVRYLYQVARGRAKEAVFAQMVTGFELAQADSRVVGLNLVMPEDWFVPMHDFDLHMHMLDYLHEVYPKVHIALHAGELAPGMVPPEGLRFHIRESVERGHAQRIGHGVDVMNETEPVQLLKELAQKNVLVEICLTSNDVILGIQGDEHPFPIYRQYGVPVTLATDDQGVSRSDMTREYLRATEDYKLSYADLKGLARMSLEHSFLPGRSLWDNARPFRRTAACAQDDPVRQGVSARCKAFLGDNPRAQQQWQLEQEFASFEKNF